MKTIYIYLLIDPRNCFVKYVGQSLDAEKRYQSHISYFPKKNTKKSSWIKSLKKKGLKPILEIIDEVSESEWQFWEQHYISLYKSWGFNLTNGDNGGRGRERGFVMPEHIVSAHKAKIKELYAAGWSPRKDKLHSEEAKEKMSKRKIGLTPWNKGIPMNKETKEKIAKSKEGKVYSCKAKGKTYTELYGEEKADVLILAAKLRATGKSKLLSSKEKTRNTLLKLNRHCTEENKQIARERNSKTILQYDLEDNFIQEFSNIKKISQLFKGDISACLNGKQKTAGGFIWKYKKI